MRLVACVMLASLTINAHFSIEEELSQAIYAELQKRELGCRGRREDEKAQELKQVQEVISSFSSLVDGAITAAHTGSVEEAAPKLMEGILGLLSLFQKRSHSSIDEEQVRSLALLAASSALTQVNQVMSKDGKKDEKFKAAELSNAIKIVKATSQIFIGIMTIASTGNVSIGAPAIAGGVVDFIDAVKEIAMLEAAAKMP